MLKLNVNCGFLFFLLLSICSSINASFLPEDEKKIAHNSTRSNITETIKFFENSLAWLPDEVTRGADGTKEDIRRRLKDLYEVQNTQLTTPSPSKDLNLPHESSFSPPLQQSESYTVPNLDILRSNSFITFKELPQEWHLPLGASLASINEGFFINDSEQHCIQRLWTPENLKNKNMLILRGQNFLDLPYITKVFTKSLPAFPNYDQTLTPTLEQMIFSLLFNQLNMYAFVHSITQPNKGRICGKYGFILDVPAENIYFVSSMDSQLPPYYTNFERAKSERKNFKEVLLTSVTQTPEQIIENSTANMNNEVGFVPSISINGEIHTIKLTGFYVVTQPKWEHFSFLPPQFASQDQFQALEIEARQQYEQATIVTDEELKKIETLAQQLKLPVYKL